MSEGGIPIGKWSGSDAVDALHNTIRDYQDTATKQTRTIIRLTWAIVTLTIAMLIGLAVQIYLAV